MSGWSRDGSYGLTQTQSWRYIGEGLTEARRRLEKAGFVVTAGAGGKWIRVEGAVSFAQIWTALTRRPSDPYMAAYHDRGRPRGK